MPEGTPEKPKSNEDVIKETAAKRANYSRSFLDKMKNIGLQNFIDTISKPPFDIKDIKPDDDESFALGIYKLQKNHLKLPDEINARGCDGMFGPFTYKRFTQMVSKYNLNKLKKTLPQNPVALTTPPKPEPAPSEGNVQPAFAEALNKMEGKKWVGKLPGNGNREVGIYIPPGVDLNKPVEFIYHFHGVSGHRIQEGAVGLNRFEQSLRGVKKYNENTGKNAILIYPLSAGRRGVLKKAKEYDANWMRAQGESIGSLHSDVLSVITDKFKLSNPASVSITIEGHSAGGSPLVNIFKTQPSVKIDKVVFLDATYGARAKKAYDNAIKYNPDMDFVVIAIGDSETDNNTTRSVEGQRGVTYRRTKGIIHGHFPERFFGGMA